MNTGTVGSRVRRIVTRARVLCGLSYAEVNRLAGLKSKGHVGHIARGTKPNPSAQTIFALSSVLGCSADWLMHGGKDAAPTDDAVRAAVEAARERAAGRRRRSA